MEIIESKLIQNQLAQQITPNAGFLRITYWGGSQHGKVSHSMMRPSPCVAFCFPCVDYCNKFTVAFTYTPPVEVNPIRPRCRFPEARVPWNFIGSDPPLSRLSLASPVRRFRLHSASREWDAAELDGDDGGGGAARRTSTALARADGRH